MRETTQVLQSHERLLCAARDLMAEVGYGAMSMRKLAERVGIQAGSLYHHVASKQDLLLDVLLDTLTQRLAAWQCGAYSRDLHGYLRFLLARQRSHPFEVTMLRHESRHIEPGKRKWLEQALACSQAPLLTIIEQGQLNGHFRVEDTAGTVEAILALVETADGMRHRMIPVDEVWIEAWITQMSLALLSAPGVAASSVCESCKAHVATISQA